MFWAVRLRLLMLLFIYAGHNATLKLRRTYARGVSHAKPEGRRVVAGVTGLEPAASCVTGRRSNQLSYTPAKKVFIVFGQPVRRRSSSYAGHCFAQDSDSAWLRHAKPEGRSVVGVERFELPTLSV